VRRRGLGDVLHYFISEEEQADARERARPVDTPQAARAPRWCLPATPKRPLSCAVAIDLAVAAARSGLETEIVAPFAQDELMLKSAEIGWRALDFSATPLGSEALERALEEITPEKQCFVVLFPDHLGPVLRQLTPGYLDGLLLPIDAAPSGPAQALAILRQLPRLLPELRIGAVLVGAATARQARELFMKVQGAARRQLGLEIEDLGEVRRDPASFRSLLRGVSVLDIDEDASSAQSLRAVCRRLVDMRAAPDPAAAPGA
jgi:hypothetical protein